MEGCGRSFHLSRREQSCWRIYEIEESKRKLVIAQLLASWYYLFLTCAHRPLIHAGNMGMMPFHCLCAPLVPVTFLSVLLMTVAKWQGWMVKGRKEIRKESTLLSITADYLKHFLLKHFPKMLSSVFFVLQQVILDFKPQELQKANCYNKCTNTLCVCLSLSLRLSVSQCIPGVCCIHSMCHLAGSSVWRLHLVPT